MFKEGTSCVQICATGTYGRTSDHLCVDCIDGCASCDGPALTDCFTCRIADDTTTYYYKVADKTECVATSCPNGQFISTRISHQCDFCASQCKTCEGEADNCTITQGCADYFYFFNDTYDCLSQCPNGLYNDDSTGFCESCASGCSICYGSSLTECTKCKIDTVPATDVPYYKVLNIDECTIDCPPGYYEEDTGLVCAPCH